MSPVSDLSLTQIRCFLAVVDAGSFAEAARRMGLSTSAVSRLIGRFEAAHGLKLLHRSTHALSPTEDGRRLIAPAREAVRSLLEFEGALGSTANERDTGWVRITAPVAFLRHCLVPLLHRFSTELGTFVWTFKPVTIDPARDPIPGTFSDGGFVYLVLHATPSCCLTGAAIIKTPNDLLRHDLIGFQTLDNAMVRP